MALFQLVSCHVVLGGDKGSVLVRNRFEPVTYPEMLLLQVVHGGEEYVTRPLCCGWEERDMEYEYERLSSLYGEQLVPQVFPNPNHQLPLGNDAMMTEEEYAAGEAASRAATARVRGKKAPPKLELPEGASEVA